MTRKSSRTRNPGSGSELPAPLRRMLDEHHAGGLEPAGCLGCSAPCCLQSGFAILENVELIYRRYLDGGLRREGFRFRAGLDLASFVAAHFDVSVRPTEAGELLLFHPRSLAPGGQPIAVPTSGDYFETRAALFDGNLWLNRGCVFLDRSRPPWPEDDGEPRRCILHATGPGLLAKPIDCVYLTCDHPGRIREPSSRQSERWFRALAQAYPHSVERWYEATR